MRTIPLILAAAVAATTAEAQTNVYYAERGHWTVANTATRCIALNRPAADFNAAPYNALEISAWPKSAISIDVFFWPGAVIMEKDYQLQLTLEAGDMKLPAKATFGDYVLASEPDMGLWRKLQDSKTLLVRVVGEPLLALSFTLEEIDWVINTLTACSTYLPKE